MNDEQIEKTILLLGKQMLKVEAELAALKTAVNVLKSSLAMHVSPAEPKDFLELFRQIEKRLLDADPNAQKRQEASDIIDVLREYRPKLHDPDA